MINKIVIQYVDEFFSKTFKQHRDKERDLISALSHIVVSNCEHVNPPREKESIAISYYAPKTAALLFDRVWGLGKKDDYYCGVPESIGCFAGTKIEVYFSALLAFYGYLRITSTPFDASGVGPS
jgi:hypothetical protein